MIVRKSKFAMRLQPSLLEELRGVAEAEDTTPNRFVNATVPYFGERAAELREEMKRASQEITKDPALMRQAERAGIESQVKSLVRQAERERGRERGRGAERDEGLER